MYAPVRRTRWKAVRRGVWATLVAGISLVRGLFLLPSGRPGTPLRALCVAAFDTLHMLRHGARLPTVELKRLATLLDLGARANAVLDHKDSSRQGRRVPWRALDEAGQRPSVVEYLRRLGILEGGRPRPGGGRRRFQAVRLYREAVVRLSLGMVATAARANPCLDEAIGATDSGGELNLLFRLAMQCQIIDDVLDYSWDRAAGLPSFLTACMSLPQGLELTRRAARNYAGDPRGAQADCVFPLRAALFLVSTGAVLVVSLRLSMCRPLAGLRPAGQADGPRRAAEGLPRRPGRRPHGGVRQEGATLARDANGAPE